MSDIIFYTRHGSRLYGLHHEGSDYDTYTVTTSLKNKAQHDVNKVTGEDKVRVGLDTFLIRVHEGSHQALEALFSPYKVWNPDYYHLQPMIDSYRVAGPEVYAKYERTIKHFCYGELKQRRHAVRLYLNLADMRQDGRFDPRVSETDLRLINSAAQRNSGDDLARVLRVL